MRRLIGALAGLGVAGLGVAGSAWAADMPLVFKAPPAPAIFGWTGVYAGAHGGFGHGKTKFFDNFPTPDGEFDGGATPNGGLFGLHAGYNHQFNDWLVLGIGGDFSWLTVKDNFYCFTFGNQTCSSSIDWVGSITGRIGVARGPWLFYVKGGPAWMRESIYDLANSSGSRGGVPAIPGDPFYGNDTRFGWTVGPGVEWAFAPQWSVFLEYQYMDFGSKSVLLTDGANNYFTEEIHQKLSLIEAGINYRFDWDGAPRVTARGYAPSAIEEDDEPVNHVTAFAGVDVGKQSYSGYTGALIAPYKDLDTSGLRFYFLGEAGTYKYPVDGGSIRGVYSSGDALAGYAFEGDNYSINLLAGVNAANHMLSDVDPDNKVQGTAIGAKVRGDAWVNPTPATLAYGEAEYSTAFQTYYTHGKLGYDVTGGQQIFVGPEVAAMGDERYDQWRVGAHVTQVRLGRVQMDVGAGYAKDSVVGSGAYVNVGFSTDF